MLGLFKTFESKARKKLKYKLQSQLITTVTNEVG